MSIVVPNADYRTIRRPGHIVVPNATANNVPKAGVNGTGSQFPDTTRVPTKQGNCFGKNGYENRTPAQKPRPRAFGDRSNAGVATSPTNRTETTGAHPNAHFFNTATLPKRTPLVSVGNATDGVDLSLGSPRIAQLIQPHERTGIGANRSRNLSKRTSYRTNMGAAPTVQTKAADTAFHPQTKKVLPKPLPKGAVEAVKIPRVLQPSFQSRSNLWYDPNNSFYTGWPQATSGRIGVGRWNTVKKGAVK